MAAEVRWIVALDAEVAISRSVVGKVLAKEIVDAEVGREELGEQREAVAIVLDCCW